MSSPRVPASPTTAAQRRLLFATWQQTGSVTRACQTANVGRRTFYYWKPRFDAGGFAALDAVQSSAPKRSQRIPPAVADQVLALGRTHPTWGKRRIAKELATTNNGTPLVSATTVQRLLEDAGLWSARAAPPPRRTPPRPSPHVDDHLPVLSIKLVPPQPSTAPVQRTRLLAQLDRVRGQRVTLVSAGAGWGKTTLLSTWASRQPAPVAWLSLDEFDTTLTRFWSAVIAALRRWVPGIGADALRMLHASEPAPPTAIVTSLLNELVALPVRAPMVLILDDYQVVDTPAVHDSVAMFIEQLPPLLRVVLASRVDPALPLARWRARGDLVELRAADLRFTADEAAAFFTHTVDDPLATAELQRLHARTEGWGAGLRLVSLALHRRADRSTFIRQLSGSHRYLADYVQAEVVARQPLPVQRFLLHTAVLPRLNAALCTAVTDEPASQTMLEWLERNNLFVVPLDDERHWYRVHDLFRDVLLAQLQATEPELLPRLHQRAAHWYATHGATREAIEHALAGDPAFAAELLHRAAPQLWRAGEVHAVHTWIGALPDAILWQHPRLALDAARQLLSAAFASVEASYSEIRIQVERTLARLEVLLNRQELAAQTTADSAPLGLPAAEVALLDRRVRLVRNLIAERAVLTRGDAEGYRLLVADAEEMCAQEQDLSWTLEALRSTYLLTESLERRGGLLIGRLLEAKQQAITIGNRPALVRVLQWLAFAYARAGQARLMERETLAALELTKQLDQRSASIGYLHYLLVNCYIGWNRLDEARRELEHVLRIAETWQSADLLIAGFTASADLALASSDLVAATEALDRAEDMVRQERFVTHAPWVHAARVRYWLAAGEIDAAARWAAQVAYSPHTWNPNRSDEFLTLVRVYVAQRRYADACAALERFSTLLDRPGDGATTIDYLALYAVALYGAEHRRHARTVAARLLALTEPAGEVRVYLDAGTPMRSLLSEVLGAPDVDDAILAPRIRAYGETLLAAFAPERTHVPGLPPARAEASIPYAPRVELLTQREYEVLQVLETGASNAEIATALVISVATVKKHVGNLLGKLGARSRTQLIARARAD